MPSYFHIVLMHSNNQIDSNNFDSYYYLIWLMMLKMMNYSNENEHELLYRDDKGEEHGTWDHNQRQLMMMMMMMTMIHVLIVVMLLQLPVQFLISLHVVF